MIAACATASLIPNSPRLAAAERADDVEQLATDVCVVGGGSAGFCAALAAARAGSDCILVERLDMLGGTSTAAFVCNWEPGCDDPFSREIYQRLRELDAAGVTSDRNADRALGSFGLWLIDPNASYDQTLRRWGRASKDWHGVVFDPDRLGQVVLGLLAATGNCRVMMNTTFVDVETQADRLVAIAAEGADGKRYRILAKVFIDSTGGGHLCRKLGHEMMLGPEPKSRFGERFAPHEPSDTLNAISLCYRVRKSTHPKQHPAPDPAANGWPRSAHVTEVPGGDLILNPLATVPGRDLIDKGYHHCMARANLLVSAQWHEFQKKPTFASYEFLRFAPTLGIRETYRVVGEYVLTQHDLEAGLVGQKHADIIALADHAMDVHGAGHARVHGEMKGPYGVPYRCLIPRGSVNVLVACRGASFSHIAASSCRLSRTMMQLGHAAGAAAAMAAEDETPLGGIDVERLREVLGMESRP